MKALEDAKSKGDNAIKIEPMEAHPILKDLVTDFDDFFEKHASVSPGLYRNDPREKYKAGKEYKQSAGERNAYLPFSYCIMCGLCMDACPVVNTNPSFKGPQALSQIYRYGMDSRDQMKDRLESVDSMDGVWGCEFA
ncbi:succinate dehydrogenase iron-sulfur subunit, partial [mine drainage metagenome]